MRLIVIDTLKSALIYSGVRQMRSIQQRDLVSRLPRKHHNTAIAH